MRSLGLNVKYFTMLFTVDVETLHQPLPSILRNCQPGYGIKTSPMRLTAGAVHYSGQLPEESETGLQVIPGRQELEFIIGLFSKCIKVPCLESQVLAYKNFHWPGHVYANDPISVQYTVIRRQDRLGCTDIDWLGELVNSQGRTACGLTIKQRNYTKM